MLFSSETKRTVQIGRFFFYLISYYKGRNLKLVKLCAFILRVCILSTLHATSLANRILSLVWNGHHQVMHYTIPFKDMPTEVNIQDVTLKFLRASIG